MITYLLTCRINLRTIMLIPHKTTAGDKWADRNLRRFTMGKRKILHLARNNYRHHTLSDLTDYRVALKTKTYICKNVCVCVRVHASEGRVQRGWSKALFNSDQ